jgi:hypothetical protein
MKGGEAIANSRELGRSRQFDDRRKARFNLIPEIRSRGSGATLPG